MKFHPQFDSDVSKAHFLANSRYVYALGGALFALTVFNPNFTRRRSWYFRKLSVFGFGVFGWNVGNKFYKDQLTYTYMRMNDYFPLEVKRALRDHDFRHLALFDLEQELAKRKMFDDKSGKSLS